MSLLTAVTFFCDWKRPKPIMQPPAVSTNVAQRQMLTSTSSVRIFTGNCQNDGQPEDKNKEIFTKGKHSANWTSGFNNFYPAAGVIVTLF